MCRGTPAPPPVVPEDGALGVEETLPAAARRHAHQLAPVQQRREVHLAVAAHPAVRHAGGVFDSASKRVHPKVRNHGEGPYSGNYHKGRAVWLA